MKFSPCNIGMIYIHFLHFLHTPLLHSSHANNRSTSLVWVRCERSCRFLRCCVWQELHDHSFDRDPRHAIRRLSLRSFLPPRIRIHGDQRHVGINDESIHLVHAQLRSIGLRTRARGFECTLGKTFRRRQAHDAPRYLPFQ